MIFEQYVKCGENVAAFRLFSRVHLCCANTTNGAAVRLAPKGEALRINKKIREILYTFWHPKLAPLRL